MLALLARPVSKFLPQLLRYRRALGVGAFVLAVAHTFHMLDHTLQWNFDAVSFMLPQHQLGNGGWDAVAAVDGTRGGYKCRSNSKFFRKAVANASPVKRSSFLAVRCTRGNHRFPLSRRL